MKDIKKKKRITQKKATVQEMRKRLGKVNGKQETAKLNQEKIKGQDVPYAMQLASINILGVGVSKSNRGKEKGCLRKEWMEHFHICIKTINHQF